ncbi:MAG: metallophosphoesterase [Elusimicrobiales bacterium]|nr:metallophosphoesterase [Elusimicrobiales bacterium]
MNKRIKPEWVKVASIILIAAMLAGLGFCFRHAIFGTIQKFAEKYLNTHRIYILIAFFDSLLAAYFIRGKKWLAMLPAAAISATLAAYHFCYIRPYDAFILNSRIMHEYIKFIASAWLGSTLVASLPLAFFAALSLIIKICRIKIKDSLHKWIPLSAAALCALYALHSGTRQPPFKEIIIESSKVSEELDGYRIVQISDIHLDSLMKMNHFKKTIERVNSLNADMILITGDLIDPGFDTSGDADGFFKSLKAKDGVYAVLGNHDKDLYHITKGKIPLLPLLKRLEIKTLCCTTKPGYTNITCGNDKRRRDRHGKYDDGYDEPLCIENIIISKSKPLFRLTGIDDIAERKAKTRRTSIAFEKWKKESKSLPEIVMIHRPLYYKEIEETRQPLLVLSGHTHRGQIYPIYKQNKFKYFYGLYKIKNTFFYVTSGTDGKGPRMRFFAPPEIPVITLRKAKK